MLELSDLKELKELKFIFLIFFDDLDLDELLFDEIFLFLDNLSNNILLSSFIVFNLLLFCFLNEESIRFDFVKFGLGIGLFEVTINFYKIIFTFSSNTFK